MQLCNNVLQQIEQHRQLVCKGYDLFEMNYDDYEYNNEERKRERDKKE